MENLDTDVTVHNVNKGNDHQPWRLCLLSEFSWSVSKEMCIEEYGEFRY